MDSSCDIRMSFRRWAGDKNISNWKGAGEGQNDKDGGFMFEYEMEMMGGLYIFRRRCRLGICGPGGASVEASNEKRRQSR